MVLTKVLHGTRLICQNFLTFEKPFSSYGFMRKSLFVLAVSLCSSVSTLILHRHFAAPMKVDWGGAPDAPTAQYANLMDRIFTTRTENPFYGAAPSDFTDAAEVSTPAVVNIRALQVTDPGWWGGGTIQGSSGSGVILSPDGYIVTNQHVVEKSSDIKVTLWDKRKYSAKLIGIDPSTDIALLKIGDEGLPFMLVGNSDSVRVGEWVLAVGNPFNLESTVTAGIVSAKGRNINILGGGASIESFIQTDAAVNPGNSGGALVNTNGELIGINTAIITESGSYEGYSFAVPSNLVQKIVSDLKSLGVVQRGFLGIGIEDLDAETADIVGLSNGEGVYVNRVNSQGGADDAGLRDGDVILELNGMKTKQTSELQELVGRFRPGDKVRVTFWRNEELKETTVTLKDLNNNISVAMYRGDELLNRYGIKLRDASRKDVERFNSVGAVVESVRRGSIIYECNMQSDFLITSVNGNKVENAAEAIEAIQNARSWVSFDGYYDSEPDLYSYRYKKED